MYCAATPAQQVQIAYNSCRNRHCPKCQARAARRWLEARQADLLPVDYYHVVFTLPAPISAIAYYNKTVIYDLLFAVAAETLRTIAADPKHLGAQVGVTLVLHTWGSALTHHPHVHGIVPGGGPRRRRRALGRLQAGLLPAGAGAVAAVPPPLPRRTRPRASRRPAAVLRRVRGTRRRAGVRRNGSRRCAQCEWVVYAKRPFAGPAAVLAYLSRYTHRVAISNQPLARPRRARRHLPLEGLPRHGQDALQDHDARAPTSSCAASCCTSCPAASTASATTACSPMPDAASISPRRANCCTSFPTARRTGSCGAGRQRAAHLRLPALRCRDEHRRDLRSRPTDSRAAHLRVAA